MPYGSSSTGPPGDARDAQEFDNTKRKATVYLFTRPVDDFPSSDMSFHHWALVFEFLGDDVRTAEGFPDKSRRLYPKYTKMPPAESGKYLDLCRMECSPADVLRAAQTNPYNDAKYVATWDNCQTWVKAMAKEMGGDLARNIGNYKECKEAHPFVSYAGQKKDSKKVFGSFGN